MLSIFLFWSFVSLVGSVKEEALDIQMPGAEPKGKDSYLCTGFNIQTSFGVSNESESVYVTGFEALATASKAHHVLLYACSEPPKGEKIWDCRHHSVCKDRTSIMFAWAKNAEAPSVPDGVSFKFSPVEYRFLVLQVHYVHELSAPDNTGIRFKFQREATKYSAGIYLLARNYLTIPPKLPSVHGDINCKVTSKIPLYPFAFRTHAHSLGSVISGYKYSPSSNEFTEIARGNPQWPQAFYPILRNVSLMSGDYLVAQCTYNSTSKNKPVYIGAESEDEMCNLYLMYYQEAKSADFIYCGNEEDSSITKRLPSDSDKLLSPNPKLEEMAMHKTTSDNSSTTPKHQQVNERRKGILTEDLEANYKLSTFKMPGARPNMTDDYLCLGKKASDMFPELKNPGVDEVYVMGFLTDASSDKAHHLIISHCGKPSGGDGEIFRCMHHQMCSSGDSKIMYAWAKDAPGINLPPDAGFVIKKDEYLVLQVHYKHPLQSPDHTSLQLKYTVNKPNYRAGMILMVRGDLNIPPLTPKTIGDVNCRIKTKEPMYLFAYRTHAHGLGSVITGYQFAFDPKTQNNSFNPLQIAKGDPQLPQTFYGMKNYVEVENGDILAARCTFDSSKKTKPTKIGFGSDDEMCNLYLMYYSNNSEDFLICVDEEIPNLQLPEDSTTRVTHQSGPKSKGRTGKKLKDADLHPVPNWPPKATADQLGQLSGVSIDVHGNPVVFHRGDRQWDQDTFDGYNEYKGDRNKPIPTNTILTLNSTGHIINAWGSNMFFMPHMITVDSQNNVWVTDVALHQVMKFPPYGGSGDKKTPLIQLGKKFEPGSDKVHFCKPTAVAVTDDGKNFFVSDGYCNSRIFKYEIRFDSNGYHQVNVDVILHWGEANGAGISSSLNNYALNIPHGLALAEDKGLLCVADRENGRVQCYNVLNGAFVKSFKPSAFGKTIYSVAYTPANGGNLLAVGGQEPFYFLNGKQPQVYVLDINDESKVLSAFGRDILSNPHDLAVSKDGSTVYTIELSPFRMTKFTNGKVLESTGGPEAPPHIPPTEPLPTQVPSSLTEHAKAVLSKHIESLGNYVPKSRLTIGISVFSALLTLLCTFCVIYRKCRKRGKGNMTRPKASSNSSWKNKTLDLGDFLGRSKNGFTRLKTDEHDEEGSSEDSDLEDFTVPALNA